MDKVLAERIAFRITHQFRKSAFSSLFGNSSKRKQAHSTPLVQPSYRDHSQPCSYRTRLEYDGATDESEELDLEHGDPIPLRRFPHDSEAGLPSWPYPDMRPDSSFNLTETVPQEQTALVQRRPSIGSWTEVGLAGFETDGLFRSGVLVGPRRRDSMESWTQIEASEVGNYSSFRTLRPSLSRDIGLNSHFSGPPGGLSRRGSISYRARADAELRDEVEAEACAVRGMLLERRTLCDTMWRSGSFSEQMLEALTHPVGARDRISRPGSRASLTTGGENSRTEEGAPETCGSVRRILPSLPDDIGSAIGEEIWKAIHDAGESLQYEKRSTGGFEASWAKSAADKKGVEGGNSDKKKRPEMSLLPKKKVEEDDNIPPQQITTPNNNSSNSLLPKAKPERIAPTSLELKQKDIIIYERAGMWASAAQHMRPEPITLADMELEDDAWAYDRDDKRISGAQSSTTQEAPRMDLNVQALARGVWMTVYGVGKSVQFVSGGGYL
ncbi:hypothetical protein GE09DRAFT_1249299 [Coniochaeta sp. 2T2.1]|nr:hypothetical protein GE09DRAFT_1249299 [Coniochaeta sp. 2T2.1]